MNRLMAAVAAATLASVVFLLATAPMIGGSSTPGSLSIGYTGVIDVPDRDDNTGAGAMATDGDLIAVHFGNDTEHGRYAGEACDLCFVE